MPLKRIEEIRRKIQEKLVLKRKAALGNLSIRPPRYDEIFFEGCRWLDSLAGPELEERRDTLMIIGKTYHFDAAHFLPEHPKCGTMHGHTYHVDVSLWGSIQKDTGMVMDFGKLDDIVKPILSELDHETLNKFIPNPTCENLTTYILKAIQKGLPLPLFNLVVKVQEGGGGWAQSC